MTARRCPIVLAAALALALAVPSVAGGRPRQAPGRLKAYMDLLDSYRREPAMAALTITTWTDNEVRQALEAFSDSLGLRSPRTLPDVRLAFTAVMLHTDAAMQWAQADSRVSAIVHLQVGASILDAMAPRTQLARDFPFAPAMWHLAVARALTALFDWDVEHSVLRTGRSEAQVPERIRDLARAAERERPGAGAQMYLAFASLEDGSVHMMRQLVQFEDTSHPRRERAQDGSWTIRHNVGITDADLDNRMRQAEGFYRRALELEPTLVEARLRLGHLLLESGRRTQARDELRRALAAATEPRDAYLACLFLGRVAEDGGDSGAALESYGRAVAAWPGAQTARIALASVHERLGHVEEVRASIAPLVDRGAATPDPWGAYFLGHADEGRRALDEMREQVRKLRTP